MHHASFLMMGGGRIATEHLIAAGRTRIGFINGPTHYEATHGRTEGYRQALAAAGLPFDPALVRAGKWHENSGRQMARELMQLANRPDGIFCASDSIAAGALDALHEMGAVVPMMWRWSGSITVRFATSTTAAYDH
jgi:LacI family transcriptional regulator